MKEKVFKILKKIYQRQNSFYNDVLKKSMYTIPEEIQKQELEYLEQEGFIPNNFETFKHDDLISRLIVLRANKNLTFESVRTWFINSLTDEGELRGRQPILSYLYLLHLEKHEFINPEIHKNSSYVCDVCGLQQSEVYDRTQLLIWTYEGNAENRLWVGTIVDLEDFVKHPHPEVNKDGLIKLKKIVDFISEAEPNETPSKLLKRIIKSKILPKAKACHQHGFLQILAELGILKNESIPPIYDSYTNQKDYFKTKVKGSSRSDIILPLAAWRGHLGVDYDRLKELFDI